MAVTEEPRFSDVGGALCLDFANTIGSYITEDANEHLNSYGDLLEWGKQTGVLSEQEAQDLMEQATEHPEDGNRVLKSAIEMRRAIYMVFSAVASDQPASQADIEMFNSYLSRALSHARILADGSNYAWGWAHVEGHLDRMLWPVARSAADLLVSGQVARIRECRGNDCTWLFVDMSKNHSRRWCDMNDCGNRAKAHRHYKRRKAEVGSQ